MSAAWRLLLTDGACGKAHSSEWRDDITLIKSCFLKNGHLHAPANANTGHSGTFHRQEGMKASRECEGLVLGKKRPLLFIRSKQVNPIRGTRSEFTVKVQW